MKIVVNNQEEADLIRRFLSASHEHSITDLLREAMAEYPNDVPELEDADLRILEEAVFWGDPEITIDPNEEELRFEDDDWVTGDCIHCGTQTTGSSDGESLTYSGWKWLDSPETRAKWRCEDCGKKLCPECSENLITDPEDDICSSCRGEA